MKFAIHRKSVWNETHENDLLSLALIKFHNEEHLNECSTRRREDVGLKLMTMLRIISNAQALDLMNIYGITYYAIFWEIVEAINSEKSLQINFFTSKEALRELANGYKARSSNGIMSHCIGAVDGLFVKITQP
eukprot:Awhi_evm1s14410